MHSPKHDATFSHARYLLTGQGYRSMLYSSTMGRQAYKKLYWDRESTVYLKGKKPQSDSIPCRASDGMEGRWLHL